MDLRAKFDSLPIESRWVFSLVKGAEVIHSQGGPEFIGCIVAKFDNREPSQLSILVENENRQYEEWEIYMDEIESMVQIIGE